MIGGPAEGSWLATQWPTGEVASSLVVQQSLGQWKLPLTLLLEAPGASEGFIGMPTLAEFDDYDWPLSLASTFENVGGLHQRSHLWVTQPIFELQLSATLPDISQPVS